MHIFYMKNSKVELHSSKISFWWSNSNFAIFSYKMSVTFEFGQNYYDYKSEEEDKKKFNWKKKSKIIFFSSCSSFA